MVDGKLGPFRLRPWFSPRPWGRRSLQPWYSAEQVGTAEPVGEAWLTGPESVIETGPMAGGTLSSVAATQSAQLMGPGTCECEFPLLVKLLFPADKLSVQVHPDDVHAREMGQPRGKTECWYVLEAEPGAKIALGLKEGTSADAVREAIAAGRMEELMEWVPVSKGEMVFVDAGTVHAIGPGMVLLETQQTCDITFRMYDYGRPRALHVDQALDVMKTHTAAGKVPPREMSGFTRLIEQKYFAVDRYELGAGNAAQVPVKSAGCLVGLSGSATVQSEGSEPVELRVGQAVVVPAEVGEVSVRSAAGANFVRCWEPG
ncbi:MAG TPA: type I phosphomannose isomerase catalytic subunit [Acidobacteriaceae bacterium]|nr:type I phosphomannose isomerase catalytic subunit [Acidobacteriaceae bacterium]